MKHIELFISDDGKIFLDESSCLEYELEKACEENKHNLIFKDDLGNVLEDMVSSKTYNFVSSIEVLNKEGIELLNRIYDYTGFLYDSITSPGTWVWKDTEQCFIKKEN